MHFPQKKSLFVSDYPAYLEVPRVLSISLTCYGVLLCFCLTLVSDLLPLVLARAYGRAFRGINQRMRRISSDSKSIRWNYYLIQFLFRFCTKFVCSTVGAGANRVSPGVGDNFNLASLLKEHTSVQRALQKFNDNFAHLIILFLLQV